MLAEAKKPKTKKSCCGDFAAVQMEEGNESESFYFASTALVINRMNMN